jgi:hypothetical protein
MKTLIDLETTGFDFSEIVSDLPMTNAWVKGGLTRVPDFGTVFMGLYKVTNPKFLDEIERAAVGDGPLFKAPENWQWAHIAKAFGIFASTSQARKNGWAGEPEPGFNFKQCRISKVKGELLVVNITDKSPWITEDDHDNKNDG